MLQFLVLILIDPPIKSFGLTAISIAEKERVTKDSRTVDEDDDDDDDSYIHMNPSDIHQAKKADMVCLICVSVWCKRDVC